MSAWLLIVSLNLGLGGTGKMAVPGIATEDECRRIYMRIKSPPGTRYFVEDARPKPGEANCIEYKVAR
jgi:hypothetical protein